MSENASKLKGASKSSDEETEQPRKTITSLHGNAKQVRQTGSRVTVYEVPGYCRRKQVR